jgi:crotonobetainyl-CoA:carnitine CoA-transferase CaiB-like acyl-CoA transferase
VSAGPPLTGLKVLDVTANMSGPFATMVLGDQGADVVKLEPLIGDPIRDLGTGSDGLSAYYANLNRSKRSLALDLTRDEARPVFDRLCDWADVVVHNYRPAAAASLGIDAESVRAGRPRVVHVTITGYGSRGPNAGRPVYDHVIQATSGFCDRQRDPSTGEPAMVRHGIVDKLTGWATAQAVCAALVQRGITGEGRAIEVCMLDVAIATLWPDGMMNHTVLEPQHERRDISSGFKVRPTADGHVVVITLTPRQIDGLRDAMGIDDSAIEGTGPARRDDITRAALRRIAELPTAEVVEALGRHEVPVAPIVALQELHAHPQVIANGTVEQFAHPTLGTIRQCAPAVRFGGDAPSVLRPAAPLGADGAEVFAMLGYGDDDYASAVAAGITR